MQVAIKFIIYFFAQNNSILIRNNAEWPFQGKGKFYQRPNQWDIKTSKGVCKLPVSIRFKYTWSFLSYAADVFKCPICDLKQNSTDSFMCSYI
jgi:hypothetical protein